MTPIISPRELISILSKPNLTLIDARNSPKPREEFEKGHLKGALFVDPNLELADIKEDLSNGGRHPLPSMESFCKVLGNLGIDSQTHVVVYDDQNGANSAARFWWMLRALGHEKAQVLEGGIQAALEIGFPTENGKSQNEAKNPYPGTKWMLGIADMQEVKEKVGEENSLVIDVRSAERYRGEQEPIDLIAGHIPGAINVPLTENMGSKGEFLQPEQLRRKYQDLIGGLSSDQVIVHCGSGVSACHTLLAFDLAGLPIPKLYVGSWSEWSRNGQPIGKGNE
ncbi:MAG: sulfurtransferase [Algoriphagus sp.]|uniref:sulfurtransferase n=1 Tax=Algoriphagus sp. TaxID=1872435 RepID=UPI0017E0A62E|nr:sulfurtransferase [Algoriphagus sp.]NVJ87777.1 sulfurtransferase [Algoriphagus sp.]